MNYSDILKFNIKELNELLKEGNVQLIKEFLDKWNLCIKDGKIVPNDKVVKLYKDAESYYDKKQLVKKISLNSAYGALLNAGSRFFDQRLGQSTTLSGRSINKHQTSRVNELIDGVYEIYGSSFVAADTDSVYFTAYPTLKNEIKKGELIWNKDTVIECYDSLVPHINNSFAPHLKKKFNVPENRSDGVIKCGRENIAENGLFIVKKRYAMLVYDKEGKRQDINGKPGKVKAMGLDLKRADTPKIVQTFLSDILLDTLTDKSEEFIINKIREFKEKFENLKPWQMGTPRSVNKLSYYREKDEHHALLKAQGKAIGGTIMPGHVRASIAWNRMRDINRDQHSMRITDGQRIIVCKLKVTPNNTLTSIAIPTDETRLPQWFLDLPFAEDEMMASIVDQKVENLLGCLNFDFSKTSKQHGHLETLFDFSKF